MRRRRRPGRPTRRPRHASLEVRNGIIQETGEPVSEERVHELLDFGEGYVIDVWDCRAHLAYVTTKAGGMTMRRVEWGLPLTGRQEAALHEVLWREIQRQGGWITTSGWYQITDYALRRIGRLVGKRRVPSLGAQVEE